MEPLEFQLGVNETKMLDKPLDVGSSVVFYSNVRDLRPDYEAQHDNTALNLLSADEDYLCHVSFRRTENAIVFNSRMTSGSWGAEERVTLQGVLEQPNPTVGMRIYEASFDILVDGTLIKTYNRSIQKDVQGIKYTTNRRSVFADTITCTITVSAPGKPLPPAVAATSQSYQQKYLTLTVDEVARESENDPFDIVIIGSGIGGGVLAADLLSKNKRLTRSQSYFTGQSTMRAMSYVTSAQSSATARDPDDRSLRILVVERGGLLFHTHSLNMPRPTSRGKFGQMNDLFYDNFKETYSMDEETSRIWKGGPVFCLGGRSAVWGLFAPRIDDHTLRTRFPEQVVKDLNEKYLRQAEETMNLSFPETLPLHRELIDRLNVRQHGSPLPTTQWIWGRIASQFRDSKNFDFAEGAYSTIDRLLEAAMDNTVAGKDERFQVLVDSQVTRLEPPPQPGKLPAQPMTHVVVTNSSGDHKIKCKRAVISAGSIESPAILLRSAGGRSIKEAYGEEFAKNFGHVTDHYIFFVSQSFFYRDPAKKEMLGGMKLQTDITFVNVDNTTAIANISLDASSFLPRRQMPDSELPQFIIAYILPSAIAHENNITLKDDKPHIKVGYADDAELDAKKELLKEFAVDVMNKISAVLDIQFVKHKTVGDNYTPMKTVTLNDITLGELGPGGVAHEMGSIPMPDHYNKGGLVDTDLQLKYGWNNVHVCDLSVFPYSPAANPTLSLAALSLRLSDRLLPTDQTLYQPIVVFNVTERPVFVSMTLSKATSPSFGPTERTRIDVGASVKWKRENNETIFVYACACTKDFNVQTVRPGINTLIVASPPESSGCDCVQ